VLEDLALADLAADSVMAGYFGLNLEQLAGRDYAPTQQVSARIHAMLDEDAVARFDGVLYPSRNNYPGMAAGLFDRTRGKVEVIVDIDLVDHIGWPDFVETYRIGVERDG
jgi:hypothetical protein